jgi:hypothetical protein
MRLPDLIRSVPWWGMVLIGVVVILGVVAAVLWWQALRV